MPNELDRDAHAKQTHCYTCGKRFERAKYECPTWGQLTILYGDGAIKNARRW
jgi:hypothetical protein